MGRAAEQHGGSSTGLSASLLEALTTNDQETSEMRNKEARQHAVRHASAAEMYEAVAIMRFLQSLKPQLENLRGVH